MSLEELLALSVEIESALGRDIEGISHFVYMHPELGLEEFESSRYLASLMAENGFSVSMPYCGLETAFRAEFGTQGPAIAFLAEYDALPGYGPERVNGHACGHNFIAAATAGAALVLSRLADKLKMRIVLFGCPAEETYCGKVKMVDEHAFDDIDIALQPHLQNGSCVCCHALAMTSLAFTFRGKASHAAASPWDGVNALDAVQLTYAGINALRQHLRPDVRIHGIITDGGYAANTVPDKASCLFYVRSAHRSYCNEVIEKVKRIADGACLMTGATVELDIPELPMDDLVNLPTLQALAEKYLHKYGIEPSMTEEEAAELAGSTDVGNVSHVCPTMYFEIDFNGAETVNCHEEAALKYVDSPEAGYVQLHKTINAMTGMALELASDPALVDKSKSELALRK